MSRILVIEDEITIRDGILDILTFEDFDVLGAENGIVGVQLAKEHKPDMIICDLIMPELDGYGVITAIRNDPDMQDIPFVFLSAKSSKSDIEKGLALGANAYLTKPFNPNDLLTAIRTHLAI